MSNQEKESIADQTFNNDHITLTASKHEKCQCTFNILVSPLAVKTAYAKASKSVSKSVVVPGFRKGKAPLQFIEENYKNAIHSEWLDVVSQVAINEAIDLSGIVPLKQGYSKRPILHECTLEQGARLTFSFEAYPEIPSVDIAHLTVPEKVAPSITAQERVNALQNLLLHFATFEPIVDRGIQPDDFVNLSLTILEKEPVEVIRDKRGQMSPTGLPNWIREKILHLKVGESAEGMTEQDLTLSEEDPEFISKPFRVTIDSIWEGKIPEADDEIAKKVGLQTREELLDQVNKRLENEVKEEIAQQNIFELESRLIAEYPIDLPQSMIDANIETRLKKHLAKLVDKQIAYKEQDIQDITKIIQEQVVRDLQLHFHFRKIAADHAIKASDEDIQKEIGHQLSLISSGRNEIDFKGDPKEMQERLYSITQTNKTKQFLMENVQFVK